MFSTKDEYVGEYFFPADTMYIANAWTIHHYAQEYDRPNDFITERFLENPFGLRPSFKADELQHSGRRALYAFSSGRRQCPGEQFAFTSVLLATSKIVWAYDIAPPPSGLDGSVETGFKDGTVRQPVHPEVLFKLRDEKRTAGLLADIDRTERVAR